MELSSTFCRTQESYHRDREASAILENIRVVAGRAASAWGLEARCAERREARRERRRILADTGALQKELPQDDGDSPFSENPDRGFADS